MTKLEALKTLYAALGGTPADAAELETVVEVLNAIAELFKGETADTIADAVNNIAEIAGGISPTPTLITKNITENGTYTASDDDADGYSSVEVNVAGGEPFAVEITAQGEVGSYTFSANKTYSETMAAIHNGDAMSFKLTVAGSESMDCQGYFIMLADPDPIISVVEGTNESVISILKWHSDDTFELAVYTPSNA